MRRLPLYNEMKVAFCLYLWHPNTKGWHESLSESYPHPRQVRRGDHIRFVVDVCGNRAHNLYHTHIIARFFRLPPHARRRLSRCAGAEFIYSGLLKPYLLNNERHIDLWLEDSKVRTQRDGLVDVAALSPSISIDILFVCLLLLLLASVRRVCLLLSCAHDRTAPWTRLCCTIKCLRWRGS